MHDPDCVQFLQWALPQLQMRWSGFRKVYAQACKRIHRRRAELGQATLEDYCHYLQQHPQEWTQLDALIRITISRFYRDKMLFVFLQHTVLPQLARQVLASGETCLKVWSVGCASGEEAYSVAIVWHLFLQAQFPQLRLQITGTDADASMCQRARQACYEYGAIKNLPAHWREQVFTSHDERYYLNPEYRQDCMFQVEDVREQVPDAKFHLLLCRNLVFTYFDTPLQQEVLQRMQGVLRKNGALVLGIHEQLPPDSQGFVVWHEKLRVYRKTD